MIMDGVFASYISRLSDEYTKIEKMSPKVKETMLADATYITDQLSQLPGVRRMDRGLIQAVEGRDTTSTTKVKLENGTKKGADVEEKKAAESEVLFETSSPVKENEKEKKDGAESQKDGV
jgi:hypothetical protein